jgi:heat shock protein HslJ
MHDDDTLRKLDISGHEIVSKLNYDLKRATTFTSIEFPSQQTADAPLENTYWKLFQLGDEPVSVASKQKEPYFILDPATGRVSGSGGCNRLVGSYTLDGNHLTFRHTAGTMMACLEGMETEKAFLQALPQVNSWKITGQRLELFDVGGKLIARFEAQTK